MLVVGGCYLESCEVPHFRGLYGSGGRAAAALADMVSVQLQTYFPSKRVAELTSLVELGVTVKAEECASAISFAYFHPLSDPVIVPAHKDVRREDPIYGGSECVLLFGMLEGEGIIDAARAIYDPQSTKGFRPFAANGSRADDLAIVLNANEVRAEAGDSDIAAAALALAARESASVLIVKAGPRGALVVEHGETLGWVPAYRSRRVFKLGTGDIFSAAFAYWWGARRLPVIEAADRASRSVAIYAESGRPSLASESDLFRTHAAPQPGLRSVEVIGSCETLGERWLLHEAVWRLSELGVIAYAPALALGIRHPGGDPIKMLLAGSRTDSFAEVVGSRSEDLIVFAEATGCEDAFTECTATQDFATAVYWAAWASGASKFAQ